MNDSTLSTPLCCTDPVAFEAVWSRVMKGRNSPITLKETTVTVESCSCVPNEPTLPSQPVLPDLPNLPNLPEGNLPDVPNRPNFPVFPNLPNLPEGNLPDVPDPLPETTPLPCFGAISVKSLLETALLTTLEGLDAYKKLERQLPYKLKGTLLESLNQRKKILNQLETAYFLLVGEDFLSQNPNTTEFIYSPPIPADQRIRGLFRQTQELQLLFKKSALETEDVCFTTLFLQLDIELKEEISTLHRILESLFWLRLK